MNGFTTKVVFLSVIVYLVLVLLVPSGECLRRYHNIRKRWGFDPIVSYYDERHGPGARSFMVYQGDWWWMNPIFSLLEIGRAIKGWLSHIPIPFIFGLLPFRFNKLLPYDDYYHFPMQVYAHIKDSIGFLGGIFTFRPASIKGAWLTVMDRKTTPDFRVPEHVITWKLRYRYTHARPLPFNHFEYHRYFRLQGCTVHDWYFRVFFNGWIPMQFSYLTRHIKYTNCYCVMVYKKHFPFAMGAVLSYRNILTSAWATELVLSKYKRRFSLINLLGVWYNSDVYNFWCFVSYRVSNNSYYATPARIVYHNLWSPPEFMNRSHPLPVMHDLALWTTTSRLLYEYGLLFGIIDILTGEGHGGKAQICHRFSYAKNSFSILGTRLRVFAPNFFQQGDPLYVISCSMVFDQGRTPYPWFRYQYLTNRDDLMKKCPIIEWGWFWCLNMRGPVARMGVDPGAALHVAWHLSNWWGLAGLATVSMRLRTKKVMTMFTVLDTYVVLIWLHDAFKGRFPWQFLDVRFRNRVDKQLDFEHYAMGPEKGENIAEWMWYPPFPFGHTWPRHAPWFWYWHYKSLPMERDFLYDVVTF